MEIAPCEGSSRLQQDTNKLYALLAFALLALLITKWGITSEGRIGSSLPGE